jgi:signal transduction histidine kinase
MNPSPTPPLYDLEAPLPAEVAGTGQGWLTRYRRYPVYSAHWARGRLWVFGSLVLAGMGFTLLPLVSAPAGEAPYGGVLQVAIQLLAPVLLGPALAVAVRRRRWPEAREQAALTMVMAAMVVGMLLFHEFGAEPMKQKVAEITGQLDEKGQRKRVVMAIGVTVSTPDDAASAAAGARPPLTPLNKAVNAISSGLITFWLAGGAGLWGVRRERLGLAAVARERELARAQAQRREAELRLSVLAAQVEPHFLFNTLAGVRSAIATDPGRASDMIDRLVDYLRASIPRLRSDGGSDSTLGSQADIVRAYLGLMASRMPRLAWAVEVPRELLTAPCPPLMLISLAENAVKHGVEPKIGPARIELRARRDEAGALEVTVEDDGAGFGASSTGSGLGLANIRERLQEIYQGRAALHLKARPQGVTATLTLPMD